MALDVEQLSRLALSANFEGESANKLIQTLSAEVERSEGSSALLQTLDRLIRPFVMSETSPDLSKLVMFCRNFLDHVNNSATEEPHSNAQRLENTLVDLIYILGYANESDIVDLSGILDQVQNIPEEGRDISQQSSLLRIQDNLDRAKKRRASLSVLVNALVREGVIPEYSLKSRLDGSILRGIDIPKGNAAQTNLIRGETRGRTALLYKQQKYNLAREESEGYSKLLVELHANVGPPHDPTTGLPAESSSIRGERVNCTLRNIQSLIGYFDLDPTRVLDIILDVFSEQIIHYHTFFRELLSASPWGPDNFNQSVPPLSSVMDIDDSSKVELPDGSLGSQKGSSIIGQVLGFKFKAQQNAHQKEVEKIWQQNKKEFKPNKLTDVTPPRLYLLAAVLVWDRTVHLSDLYPHLSPSDQEMSSLKDKHEDEMEEKAVAGSDNKLAMMGALVDEDAPEETAMQTDKEAEEPVPHELPNQKVSLLRALLHVGSLQEAMFILGKFPFIAGPFPAVADSILRSLDYMITPAYKPLSLSSIKPEISTALSSLASRYSVTEKKLVDPPAVVHRLTSSTRPTGESGVKDVYFWPHWSSRLPTYTNPEEIAKNVGHIMLRFVGPRTAQNVTFFSKLCRVISHDFEVNGDDARERWLTTLRVYLLPSVCLSDKNSAVSVEIWSVLSCFEAPERFTFYGELMGNYMRIAELKLRKSEITREARDYMRRLSTETVKTVGRSLAKLAHSNPLIVNEVMLNQVMSYDNFVGPATEATRYFGPFESDAIQYSLLTTFANADREIVKSDGTSLSLWLTSLASYTASLLRRTPSQSTLILKFLVHQLENRNTDFLIILREILEKMSGIAPIPDLNSQQIRALGGGKVLRMDVLSPTETRPPIKIGLQLRAALTQDLTQKLLVHLALARQAVLYVVSESETNLKFLGNMYDQCNAIMAQYTDFLVQVDPEYYANLVPSLEDLVCKFGVDLTVAFTLIRPVIWSNVKSYDERKAKDEEAAEAEAQNAKESTEEAARLEALRKQILERASPKIDSNGQKSAGISEDGKNISEETGEEKVQDENTETETENAQEDPNEKDEEMEEKAEIKEEDEMHEKGLGDSNKETESNAMVDKIPIKTEAEEEVNEQPLQAERLDSDDAEDENAVPPDEEDSAAKDEQNSAVAVEPSVNEYPWNPALSNIMEQISNYLSGEEIQNLSVGLYTTFWQLSLYDIRNLGEVYDKQVLRLKNVISGAQNAYEEVMHQSNVDPAVRRKRRTMAETLARVCPVTIEKLEAEKKQQQTDHGYTKRRLLREKDHWFPHKTPSPKMREYISHTLMEMCIFARIRLSSTDAVYSAYFLRILHSLGTPGFVTLTFYDKCLFPDHQSLAPMIFQMTEAEASNYGIFLYEILSLLTSWLKDPELYKKEAIGEENNLPGFVIRGFGRRSENLDEDHFLTHPRFKTVMSKWQSRLLSSFKHCLDSKEYMRVRNTLMIVYKIADFFPRYAPSPDELENSVKELSNDHRGDIKMLVQGYLAILSKQRQRGFWENRSVDQNVTSVSNAAEPIVGEEQARSKSSDMQPQTSTPIAQPTPSTSTSTSASPMHSTAETRLAGTSSTGPASYERPSRRYEESSLRPLPSRPAAREGVEPSRQPGVYDRETARIPEGSPGRETRSSVNADADQLRRGDRRQDRERERDQEKDRDAIRRASGRYDSHRERRERRETDEPWTGANGRHNMETDEARDSHSRGDRDRDRDRDRAGTRREHRDRTTREGKEKTGKYDKARSSDDREASGTKRKDRHERDEEERNTIREVSVEMEDGTKRRRTASQRKDVQMSPSRGSDENTAAPSAPRAFLEQYRRPTASPAGESSPVASDHGRSDTPVVEPAQPAQMSIRGASGSLSGIANLPPKPSTETTAGHRDDRDRRQTGGGPNMLMRAVSDTGRTQRRRANGENNENADGEEEGRSDSLRNRLQPSRSSQRTRRY